MVVISTHIASFINIFCRLHTTVTTYRVNCYKSAGGRVGLSCYNKQEYYFRQCALHSSPSKQNMLENVFEISFF